MNIVFFIRLLQKHLWLLLTIPIVMACLVFLLTRNQPSKFTSHTKIYTGIATGSSIVSLEESKSDFFATRIAFDNLINLIKSKATIEELGLRLFTQHMLLEDPNFSKIQPDNYRDLLKIVPKQVRALVVKGDFNKTYENFTRYRNKDFDNFIYELVHLNHRHYSTKKILEKIKVSRVQSSDMLLIEYSTDDPGICKATLLLLNEIFVRIYSDIKVNQSDAVVRYFQREIEKAKIALNIAEDELVSFNKKNTIINYYEQTKHIASEKEHFDLMYTEVLMKHKGANEVLKSLEKKLSEGQQRRVNSKIMLNLRDSLLVLNYKISSINTRSEVFGKLSEADSEKMAQLKQMESALSDSIRKGVSTQYNLEHNLEGLAGKNVLEEWLDKMVEFESTKAQIEVGKQIYRDFDELFARFAPLGATMKRLERKIDVAEQKYLSLLNSLNTAKLKQQNIELNSNLKVIAEPFFPIEAEPSKRKFLIVIAFLLGAIIPAFVILVLEFLDTCIKTVRRAEEKIGLKVMGVFPKVKKEISINFCIDKSIDIILRRILLFNSENEKKHPLKIIVFSNYSGEGKTYLINLLRAKCKNVGINSLQISPHVMPSRQNETISYDINKISKLKGFCDVFSDGLEDKSTDYLFIELPAIIYNNYPLEWIKDADLLLHVVRANRAWSEADKNALKDVNQITEGENCFVLLNGVELSEMELLLGDLPKKRSLLRKMLKNLLRLRFFTNSNIL